MSELPPDSPDSDDTVQACPPTPTIATAHLADSHETADGTSTSPNYFVNMPEEDIAWAKDPTHFDPDWLSQQGIFASEAAQTVDPITPSRPSQVAQPPEQHSSTPFRFTTQTPLTSTEEMRKVILDELGTKLYFIEHWATTLYREEAPLKDIVKFLNRRTTRYHKSRWVKLPEVPETEQELYPLFIDIISDIVEEFSTASGHGGTRQVLDTSLVRFRHKEANHEGTSPDISIKATGPSFEGLEANSGTPSQLALGVGWSNVAAVIEVKRDKYKDKITDHAKQIALSCRQIWMHQPNRNFVRAALLTENYICLGHLDRSGLYLTPYIDIHKDPYTFVRLIVGLSTCNEAVLGFDTSVQWRLNQKTGRRISGTVDVYDDDTETTTRYELCIKTAPFIRASIRGRGTTCYRAVHPDDGRYVVIKDSWRTETRTPEVEFLKAAKGLDGDSAAHETFYNRVKSRVVMESYEGFLNTFTSRYQLIAAFRDAILGHQRLLLKGVIHRDIGMNNILLGVPNAKHGNRGILIDLDMAAWISQNMPSPNQDYRTASALFGPGAQRYYSIYMIYLRQKKFPSVHDFLDDLESFFWVLLDILTTYPISKNLKQVKDEEFEEHMANMDSKELYTVLTAKRSVLTWHAGCKSNAWWGTACDVLLKEYQYVLRDATAKKEKIRVEGKVTTQEKYEKMVKLGSVEESGPYYLDITNAFDKALAAIEAEEDDNCFPQEPNSPSPPERATRRPATTVPPPIRRNNLKRRSEALHPEVTHVKRVVKNVRGVQPVEGDSDGESESDQED
ncbi:hypothetical protein DFP72DRAFT_1091924 [Ephemerocybe angulata]|uniref:Fungal-type protein kinase domain-containing protein n=1 Tax=Ephemerocybe angulata TaxID=980116 RepID=A0A8H6I882_9AGAR|nr:hypothetical protein DFP72DRAFT_1091924 [Tulosesus angulatus]